MIYQQELTSKLLNIFTAMEERPFTVNEFGVVARSKREAYDLLSIKGGYYLPPIEQAKVDYISDILSGDKKVIISAEFCVGTED